MRPVDPGPTVGPIVPGSPAPCRRACPVGTDAAAYVALIAEGRWAEAYDVARGPNPFPSICGRVCAAPCEDACRRGMVEQPIAIRALKRVLTETHGVEAAQAGRWRRGLPPVPASTAPPVAIVGAGPAGMAAAHDLRLRGHAVTVFEREARPGGMLAYGVPSFRLPRGIIDGELDAIVDLGVTLKTGCEVGRDVTFGELLDDHAAVIVGVGCQEGRDLATPGVELPGVLRAIDFLRQVNAPPLGQAPLAAPVVVVGGGSVAFDAARSAWRIQGEQGGHGQTMLDAARLAMRSREGRRSGAPAVTLVAPEPREALNVPPEELEQAAQEGLFIRDRAGVRRMVGGDRVEGVEIAPVRSLYDEQGAFAPRLDESAREVLPAGTVVLAVGQRSETSFLSGVSGVDRAPWGGIQADRWGRTGHPRIFATGDVASGPGNLIAAIASGQRTAAAVVQALAAGDPASGEAGIVPRAVPPERAVTPPPVPQAPPWSGLPRYWTRYDATPRVRLPLRPVDERGTTAEVEAVFSREAAVVEADRCLRCDEHLQLAAHRCIACALCVDVCPYGCLATTPAAGRVALLFDDDTCIRCRLCVDRCPADALGFALAPQ